MKYKLLAILFLLLFLDCFYAVERDLITVEKIEKLAALNPELAYRQGIKINSDTKLDSKNKLRLLLLLTKISNETKRYSEALHLGNEGLELSVKSKKTLFELKFLGILGNIYQSLKVNDKTKYYLNRAEDLLKKTKLPASQQHIKGNILYLKGMNYAFTLDCNMALEYFDQSINAYKISDHPLTKINIKLAYLNKAFCLLEMNKLKDAEYYLNLSQINTYKNLKKSGIPESYIMIINQSVELGFAKLFSLKNNFQLSNERLLAILKVKNTTNISEIEADVYTQLSSNFLRLKNIEKSKFYQSLYRQKISQEDKNQIQILNKLLQQEKELSKDKIDRNSENAVYLFILLVCVFALISFILLKKLKKIKQQNKSIENEIYVIDN